MRKIILLCLMAAIFLCTKYGQAGSIPENITIYYADKALRTLVPVTYTPKSNNSYKQAKEIINNLKNDNKSESILKFIPPSAQLDLKITGRKICINLPARLADNIPKNSETERLFVYQLVNSLTSINGIDTVSFTIDGKIQRNFLGFIDMREIFVPDYFI